MRRFFVGTALLLVLSFPLGVWAAGVRTISASGEVVAVQTRVQPNTIVVLTKTWKGLDFIVGAVVDGSTEIVVGGKAASLSDVSAGDKVRIVYERNLRVVAKRISVK